ncbi:MAG: hypothetical protein KF778_15650 [Rhodocyclaceae bacterium]|nr:hypothetical protein [Rhodocyclaceae bacterium]
MSGPTSVLLIPAAAPILLAAAAIRAARAMQNAYQDAESLASDQAFAAAERAARQSAAQAAGMEALAQRQDAAQARLTRLRAAAAQLGIATGAELPAAPEQDAPALRGAYVAGLEEQCALLQSAIADHSAGTAPADAGLDEIEVLLPHGDLQARLDAYARRQTPQQAAEVRRLLARVAHRGSLPEAVARLVEQLETAGTPERHAALLTELRRAVQQAAEQELAEAEALVLEQSLLDLGYQVEPIAHTLFAQGGLVHFRKPGWGNYMVRMRFHAAAKSANFNVIRAVEAGANETSVLDHLAEDRWCAEFPALLASLAERGLKLDVTRRLAAGEVPVQFVERGKLPQFTEEESTRREQAPLQKTLR